MDEPVEEPVDEGRPETARPRRFPRGPTVWRGSYTCGQGLTRLELTVTRDAQTNDLTATFAFSAHPKNPGVPSGRFTLAGAYDAEEGGVKLSPVAWLDQPRRYLMVGLEGTLTVEPMTLAGSVTRDGEEPTGCTTFWLRRVEPGEDWPEEPSPPRLLARVNGEELDEAELDAHRQARGLSREAALDDLIEEVLVRQAALRLGRTLPAEPWSDASRAALERDLAGALGVRLPRFPDTLTVDHAWVKDGKNARQRAEQRRDIERLRQRVAHGERLAVAWQALDLDGELWHIGEAEEYSIAILPEGAARLAAGDLSAVLPGDGGLHLFKVLGRASTPIPDTALHALLLGRLRGGAEIETFE
jgi:hypothetical protein